MIFRSSIIAILLILNYVKSPSFWEFIGFIAIGFVVILLTMLPLVGWLVVIGCGYLTYNFIHNILEWHWVISLIIAFLISGLMANLLSGNQQYRNRYDF